MSDDVFEAHFAALRDRFRAQLPAYGERLRQARGRFADGDGEGAVRDLKALAHELAGASGMFGLPVLADAAQALERAADAVLEDGADPGLVIMPLRELIRELDLSV